jgi:hypothetical protein
MGRSTSTGRLGRGFSGLRLNGWFAACQGLIAFDQPETDNLARDAIVEDFQITGLEIGDALPFLIANHHVQQHFLGSCPNGHMFGPRNGLRRWLLCQRVNAGGNGTNQNCLFHRRVLPALQLQLYGSSSMVPALWF